MNLNRLLITIMGLFSSAVGICGKTLLRGMYLPTLDNCDASDRQYDFVINSFTTFIFLMQDSHIWDQSVLQGLCLAMWKIYG